MDRPLLRACRRFLLALGAVSLIALALPYLIPLPERAPLTPVAQLDTAGRYVIANGYKTYIESAGSPDTPAVILLHGFGGSTANWHETLPALAEAGYYAVALDLKGFGLADKRFDEDYTHAAQADFVAALMDELHIQSATIVGHSMGGSVASHFYLRHPHRTTALIQVAGGAFHMTGEGRSSGLSDLLDLPPIRRLAQHALRRMVTPETVVRRLHTAYSDPDQFTPQRQADALRALSTDDWDLAYLAIIRDGSENGLPVWFDGRDLPILLVWGDRDRWISLRTGQRYYNRLPGSQMIVLEGVGHLPMEEDSEGFNRALLQFLQATVATRTDSAENATTPEILHSRPTR